MEDKHGESRAEPPPPRRLSVSLGIVLVCGLVAWGVVTLLRERRAPLPNGLIGLRFGMSESEITSQYPEVKRVDGELVRDTVAFEQRARCVLGMNAEERLNVIQCRVAAGGDEAMQQAAGRALAVARSVYGKESRAELSSWTWRGSASTLVIRAEPAASRLLIEAKPVAAP